MDPAAGPVQQLAAELRELRRAAGLPTYRELARRTDGAYSAATLSRAASGSRLPSLACTLAYAEACGAAREEWAKRWRRAAAEVRGDRTGPDARAGAVPPRARTTDPGPSRSRPAAAARTPEPRRDGVHGSAGRPGDGGRGSAGRPGDGARRDDPPAPGPGLSRDGPR